MADTIPYLVPSQFQESIFPFITRPKIPAQLMGKKGQVGSGEVWFGF
jgi:hypothetical protein